MATKVTKPTTLVYRFKWVDNKQRITKKMRPFNELDKVPGQIDAVTMMDMVFNFEQSEYFKTLETERKNKKYLERIKQIPQQYKLIPKIEYIEVSTLMSALAVQRPIDNDHVMKIVRDWDSRRPAVINVIRDPITKLCYITDGQHTALAYALRAKLGMFPDVDAKDWKTLKVVCQVVETSDMSFAREHFIGINGADKLKLNGFDQWKNKVLSARQDGSTVDEYQIALQIQIELEKNDIIVTNNDLIESNKPGAFSRPDLLGKVDIEDVRFFARNHKQYWPQETVDSIEVLPFQRLRKALVRTGTDFTTTEFKEFMRDLNATVKETVGSWPRLKNLTEEIYTPYYRKAHSDPDFKGSPHKDASISLLLKMYREAGGTYQFFPSSIADLFMENGYDLFDFLPKAKKELFK